MKLDHVRHALAIALMLGPGKTVRDIDAALNQVDPDNEWDGGAVRLHEDGYLDLVDGVYFLADKGREVLK